MVMFYEYIAVNEIVYKEITTQRLMPRRKRKIHVLVISTVYTVPLMLNSRISCSACSTRWSR